MEVREASARYVSQQDSACPSGYKQTEVGVIPEDWTVQALITLIDSSRSIRYGIVQPGRYDPRGRFMVRGQDYSAGWVDPSELFRVSAAVEERYANARIRTGDILITIVGASTGRVAVVPRWLDGANLTQTTARVAINDVKANTPYCSFVLSSWYGVRQVQNYIKGGAQPGLNCGDIEKFLIPLPPTKAEQEAIAEALSDADVLIESLEQLLAKKRHLKQGAMQQLLTGKKRLPGFSGEWEVKQLGGILSRVTNGAVYRPTSSLGLPITRIETIADGTIDYSRTGTAQPTPELSNYKLLPGDILFSHINSVDHIGKVAQYFGERDLYHGMNLLLLRVNEQADNRFLYFWLTSETARAKARTLAKQAVSQASINTSELKAMEINLPPVSEQTAIATILSDMDAELAALEEKLVKSRALKQGLIQELLTGRIRLV